MKHFKLISITLIVAYILYAPYAMERDAKQQLNPIQQAEVELQTLEDRAAQNKESSQRLSESIAIAKSNLKLAQKDQSLGVR